MQQFEFFSKYISKEKILLKKICENVVCDFSFLFQRMNSCISAPQDEILVALHDGNLQLFIDKLYEDDLNINHEYAEHEGGSTLLYLCVE